MSGFALPRPMRRRASAPAARALGSSPEASDPAPLLRLATFAALTAFCCAHWVGLLAGPPTWRTVGVVFVGCATAALLLVLGRVRLPRPAVHLLAVAVVVAGLGAALAAMGLPVRLLAPRAWDEIGPYLDRGFAGIRTIQWPYSAEDEKVRLVVLLGAPLLVIVAAALAFWPVRRAGALLRGLGLIALLALYGIAVTEHDPGEALVRGFFLFLLVAAWLWLPRLRGRAALVSGAVVFAVALLAMPLASRLDAEAAVVDYRSWNWFGGEDIVFNWNHTYGPLNWPRDGTILLNVKADRPMYWKAETLDNFDGLRWSRTDTNERSGAFEELPEEPEREWVEEIEVTVRSLETDFLIGSGTPFDVEGAGQSISGSSDGTLRTLDEPLRRGDSYSVQAYVPNPSERRLRDAGSAYSAQLAQYTRVELPVPGETALPDGSSAVTEQTDRPVVEVPLWDPASGRAPEDPALDASPYGRTYRLARELTSGALNVHAAVTRVEEHVRGEYTYSERPPTQEYPLEAFLFEDKIGYCQQFSGAMALMLRMSGIPARVVSGFSPGSLDEEAGEFEVTDLDAHSWVEVYFPDIGWVTYDPTPRAAPADRAGLGPESEPLDIPSGGSTSSLGGDAPLPDRAGGDAATVGPGGAAGEDEGSGLLAALALGLLASAGAAVLFVRSRRRGRDASSAADAGLRELERALPRLGWALGGGTTLLELENRLRRAAGPAAARYVARLREGRYSSGRPQRPAPGERRALRRELSAPGGLRTRLRGYLALPPGGPR